MLELCQKNVETNASALGGRSGTIAVRHLDWRHPFSDCCEAEGDGGVVKFNILSSCRILLESARHGISLPCFTDTGI